MSVLLFNTSMYNIQTSSAGVSGTITVGTDAFDNAYGYAAYSDFAAGISPYGSLSPTTFDGVEIRTIFANSIGTYNESILISMITGTPQDHFESITLDSSWGTHTFESASADKFQDNGGISQWTWSTGSITGVSLYWDSGDVGTEYSLVIR